MQFTIDLDGKPDSELDIIAYAFDHRGSFIGSAPLKGQQVQFNTKNDDVPARILFAPPLAEERNAAPTIEELERMRAYEPMWLYDPKKFEYELLPIPD